MIAKGVSAHASARLEGRAVAASGRRAKAYGETKPGGSRSQGKLPEGGRSSTLGRSSAQGERPPSPGGMVTSLPPSDVDVPSVPAIFGRTATGPAGSRGSASSRGPASSRGSAGSRGPAGAGRASRGGLLTAGRRERDDEQRPPAQKRASLHQYFTQSSSPGLIAVSAVTPAVVLMSSVVATLEL